MSLADASAVLETSSGHYEGAIAAGWDIVGNANGGYLLAIASRAASQSVDGLVPASVTAHYLAPGKPGRVTVDTKVEKRGKQFSTVRATMHDNARPVLALLGSFTTVAQEEHSVQRLEASPPDLPKPEDCVPMEPGDTFPPPFLGKVELRLHPEDATFSSGIPRFRGWFRLRDEEPIDHFGLLVAVDAFPPTVFAAQLPIAWTPTLELTAHVRGLPEPGWLRCLFTTRFISAGYLEEDGEVWDASGRLVAQSRQLALLPKQR